MFVIGIYMAKRTQGKGKLEETTEISNRLSEASARSEDD